MEKEKHRKLCLLLYPLEDETHAKAIDYIKEFYDYALIVHDKDKTEDGDLKKSHTHIVINFKNPKYITPIAKELGITENYIQPCRSYPLALKYLIHYNEETKHQYSIELVQGSLKKKLKELLSNDGKSEHEKVNELIDYLDYYDGFMTKTHFIRYCNSLFYTDICRRYWQLFLPFIEDNNYRFDINGNYKER